ncbi:MAG: hypothetical protein C0498_01305 [Anaerolinea sp.]|nr:hypothetical protein [Anaerolinea sp.]
MAEVGNLVVRLRGDRSQLSSTLAASKNELRGFSDSARATGGVLKTALGTAIGFGAATLGLNAMGDAVGFLKGAFIDFNSRLEQAQIGFTTLLGSSSKATAFIAEMKDFAARTPFEFPGLQDAAQRMLAMGFSSEEVLPKLTAVGDAVAALGGSGETLNRVTYALGQMKTAGRVNAQDMMQLTNAGIPAWQMLADAIGASVAQTRKLAEQGLIPADQAIAAITTGMEQRFGGMMAKQSRTFQGAMSTVKDSLNNALATAFKPFFEEISKGVDGLGQALSSSEFQAGAARIGSSVAGIARQFGSLVRAVVPTLADVARSLGATLGPALARNAALIGGFVGKLVGIGVAFARDVAPAIGAVAATLADLGASIVKTLGPVVLRITSALAGFAAVIIKTVIPIVVDLAKRVFDGGLGKALRAVGELVGWLIGKLAAFVGWITSNKVLMAALGAVADLIGAAFGRVADVVGALPGVVEWAFRAVGVVVRGIVNAFIDGINTLIAGYNMLPFDDIPKLARWVDESVRKMAGALKDDDIRKWRVGMDGAVRSTAQLASQAGRLKDDMVGLRGQVGGATGDTDRASKKADQYRVSLDGVGKGAAGAKTKLRELATDMKDRLSRAFDAVRERAAVFFKKLNEENLRAIRAARDLANAQIDAQIAAIEGPLSEARRAIEEKRRAREEERLQRGVADARGAQVDPSDPNAVRDSQRAIEEAELALSDFYDDQRLRRMEEEARSQIDRLEQQRKANDDLARIQEEAEAKRYEAQVKAFDKELLLLQQYLSKHPEEWRKTNAQVLELLDKYGISFYNSGATLGEAFAEGLRSQAKAVAAAAAALAAAATKFLKVKSPAEAGPLAEDQSAWGANLASSWLRGLSSGLSNVTLPGLSVIAETMQGSRGPAPVSAPGPGGREVHLHAHLHAGTVIATEGEQRNFVRGAMRLMQEELYRQGQQTLAAARIGG